MPTSTNQSVTARASEVIARCQTLTRFSEDTGSLRRTFLSPPMRDCHRAIAEWLQPLGISTSIDAVGNLRSVYPGAHAHAPRLLVGSHLDTVPNAGAYDGMLGVVLAIALLEELDGRQLPFAIEVVAFSEEEGVRFGPFLGSRALAGSVDEELLNRVDSKGVSVREAIRQFGLDPAQLPAARVQNEHVLGYIEFHIEQGPVLESLGLPLAAVETIVGQTRLALTFVGQANHAGTTPMTARRDALAGAAEWMVAVETEARRTAGLVATIGAIHAQPGATNVVPGEVRLTLDLRHASDDLRSRAVEHLLTIAREICARRCLALDITALLEQCAVAMDPFLTAQIEVAMRAAGCSPHRMPSGAGHDAMILAPVVPSAMIFLRTPGGVSHDPAESVLPEDVARAIDCGSHLLQQLAASPEFLRSASLQSHHQAHQQRTNQPRG